MIMRSVILGLWCIKRTAQIRTLSDIIMMAVRRKALVNSILSRQASSLSYFVKIRLVPKEVFFYVLGLAL